MNASAPPVKGFLEHQFTSGLNGPEIRRDSPPVDLMGHRSAGVNNARGRWYARSRWAPTLDRYQLPPLPLNMSDCGVVAPGKALHIWPCFYQSIKWENVFQEKQSERGLLPSRNRSRVGNPASRS